MITWQGALWSPTDGTDSHRDIYLVIKSSLLYIIQCIKFSSEDNYSDIRANLRGYNNIYNSGFITKSYNKDATIDAIIPDIKPFQKKVV